MSRVMLDLNRIDPSRLPAVCICCGEPAELFQKQQFIFTPWYARMFAFLGTWMYWKCNTRIPLCRAHEWHFRTRWVLPLTLAILGGCLLGLGYAVLEFTQGKEQAAKFGNWWALAFALGFISLMLLGETLRRAGVHARHIDEDSITFENVNDRFALIVTRLQDGEEADEIEDSEVLDDPEVVEEAEEIDDFDE